MCCVHTIYCRENELVDIRIFSSVLSLHAGLRLVACAADAAKRFPPVRLGGRKVREVGGLWVRVCAHCRQGWLPLHSILFSLSLSPTQYTYRHTEHTVSDLQCMSKVCCAFYFPPFSVYRRSQAKMRERLYKSFIFSTRPAVLMMPIIPRKKKIIIGNW